MNRSQSKLTYGLFVAALARIASLKTPKTGNKKKYPTCGTSVISLGTVLKKRKGKIEAFRYERKPNGQIVKVTA